ncbi:MULTISPECIES: ABC transporter substrate-binding protein [Rhodococcus]|uniref:Peptide/nickel transport system substrate-binding protein n=2 Tax=Nocardiaceae TaxID=85025 RepID=A0A652YHY7_NOCGL|nr:ABC transporter substrate-binding protein [Rhodococcus globerulus]NMD64452.1 ABC transporter substrate-binding protein [Nocardia globerula]MCE4268743.1 ABC transporter substrate-binding protein [Rhodococcus globerulus]MDV6271709.1 ABC transporter substrate-binding protein [Rhodococcus globerulus]PVX63433.1 peptide/nickel transport system substrate-binding protein [Rhodococcus globerulus]QXW05194.1 ABC transporter substrate-binding protein [Rhodococcus globerulus]
MITRSVRIGVAIAALSLVLSACGSGSAGNSSPALGGAVGAAAADADPNGHLRVGHTVATPALNPHKMPSAPAAYPYLTPVYDRLTQMVDEDGSLAIAPMVATEWEFSEDGREVVFTLRDGITFTDGEVLDAAAVKATLDHAKTAAGSTVASTFSMIDSVEVVDPNRVKVIATRPAADLPFVLSGVEAALISPKALDNPDLDINPVGSGPYVATSVRIGDSVTYERREGYWDPAAQLSKTITITGIVDDNARLNALRSGQIDLMISKIGQYPQASALGSGYGFFSYPPAQLYTMAMNIDSPEFSDVRVRQALNFAVDREGINSSLLNNQCQVSGQPLSVGADGHLSDPPIDYTYDPDRARALLAEAGVNGLTFNTLLGAGLSPQDEIASALQAQFAEVGVTMNAKPVDLVDMTAQFAAKAQPSIVSVRVGDPSSAQFLNRNYTVPRLFPGTLPAEFKNSLAPAFDPNVSEVDRTAALEATSAVAVENAFDVFLCAVSTQFAFADNVIGASNMGVSHYTGVMDLRYVGVAK